MSAGTQFVFPPFTFDVANQCLLRGGEKVFLRSKSFAVLRYLIEHPHRPVARDELMEGVWPKAKVVATGLRVSIQEIRKALGDNPAKPKFIETVGKNGYRFIASISLKMAQPFGSKSSLPFVGRYAEVEQLRSQLELAKSGKRQVVFVTGEPGIGKTTLVDAFTSGLSTNEPVLAARGQCIEQYGSGEAYLPVLDVLEQLCRAASGEEIIAMLREVAPSWLLNLPALISAEEREFLARQCIGITAERRLREITAFFEQIAKDCTLALVLEDLHWVDPSTLALISFLARRRESARLLLIGTYRSGEVERYNPPLKAVATELTLHQFCAQLPLNLLSRGAVEEYLATRFDQPTVSRSLASTVYSRSEGNPLFMVNVTDYLVNQQAIVRDNEAIKLATHGDQEPVPTTLRELINRQFEGLAPGDQELLETASVVGVNFSVALLARVLCREREVVEQRCRELAEREQFLQYAGLRKRPSGASAAIYSFTHALYQNVIYQRVGQAKRRRLHRVTGELLEKVFQQATEQVAAELALHFERAGDNECAVKYMLQAAQKSFSVSANAETCDYADKALSLAQSLPATSTRREMELNLRLLIAVATCAAKGYAAEETGHAFAQAQALSGAVNNDELSFQTLAGFWSFYLLRGELQKALELAQDLLKLARRTDNRNFFVNAHMMVGVAHSYLGQFEAAHNHSKRAVPYYDFNFHRSTVSLFGWDPVVIAYCYDAQALWILGFPERAQQAAQNALALAKKLASPFNEAVLCALYATYCAYCRDAVKGLEMAEATLEISLDRGFFHWIALGNIHKGWSLCRLGDVNQGLPLLLKGLQQWKSMGAEMSMPLFLTHLAEIYLAGGKSAKALLAVEEGLAIAVRNNERQYDAELYRLKGELLLKRSKNKPADYFVKAERCFKHAIGIARTQKARSLELRSAMQLARLWQATGKRTEAYQMLRKTYGWFTEGFDTPDLKTAKELLDHLS
jgi:DNA-binding winged helix-turn-helix (wHTH) protein/tetratricopeptide (TPR) repeat protein